MNFNNDLKFLDFLSSVEGDGTVIIKVPLEKLDNEIHKRLSNGENFPLMEQRKWVLNQSFKGNKFLFFLCNNKKTKIRSLNVRKYREETFYEMWFNFFDLIEYPVRNEDWAFDWIEKVMKQWKELSREDGLEFSFNDKEKEFYLTYKKDGIVYSKKMTLSSESHLGLFQTFIHNIIQGSAKTGYLSCKVSYNDF